MAVTIHTNRQNTHKHTYAYTLKNDNDRIERNRLERHFGEIGRFLLAYRNVQEE